MKILETFFIYTFFINKLAIHIIIEIFFSFITLYKNWSILVNNYNLKLIFLKIFYP